MKVNEAKIRFEAGIFKECHVVDAPMGNGYNVILKGKKESDTAIIESQRSTEARVFKSLDGAHSTAKQIGFRKVITTFSGTI